MDIDMHDQDEEKSLFGSPPSSPGRGRSPSPTLALPGTSSGSGLISSTQNVGAIALPGLQHRSELAIKPLALSSSILAPRPPAQPRSQERNQVLSHEAASSSSSPAESRSSSVARTQPNRTRSKRRVNTSPRPPPPEIPLPDPSEPPPANFLRNQSALLGTAGLVSGVKPSTLSQRHTRGSTSSNPIVVEDVSPSLSRKYQKPYYANVDPATLPPPSNEEIVQTLVRQKNIFPLLQNILKLVSSGATPFLGSQPQQPPGFQRRNAVVSSAGETQEPAPKKRRLNRVPAGAADWDVPYPFQQGDGPQEYTTNWNQERGKQLIVQLKSLIKDAAKKTAVKNYVQQEEWRRLQEQMRQERLAGNASGMDNFDVDKLSPYYRPVTMRYGLTNVPALPAKPTEVLKDASNGSTKSQPSPPSQSRRSEEDSFQSDFDQLLSSLLSASFTSTEGEQPPSASAETPFIPPTTPDADIDPALLDNWMSIFQSFPVPEGGFPLPDDAQGTSGMPSSTGMGDIFSIPSSAIGNDLTFDFDPLDFLTPSTEPSASATDERLSQNFTEDFAATFDFSESHCAAHVASMSQSLDLSSLGIPRLQAQPNQLSQAFSDSAIDPTLLALSIRHSHSSASTASWDGSTPTLSSAGSPMPSGSELGPMTPSSAGWDQALPDVFTGTASAEDTPNRTVSSGGTQDILTAHDKGKGKEIRNSTPGLPALLRINPLLSIPSTGFVPIPQRPFISSDKVLKKDDVLSRARVRRKQLADEIVKVRMELWETTIEQGVLTYLSKHSN